MANYSLVNVSKDHGNGLIDGVWMQNCCGTTLEDATKRARNTEKVNSNAIIVAVVDDLNYSCPNYSLRMKLKRLD